MTEQDLKEQLHVRLSQFSELREGCVESSLSPSMVWQPRTITIAVPQTMTTADWHIKELTDTSITHNGKNRGGLCFPRLQLWLAWADRKLIGFEYIHSSFPDWKRSPEYPTFRIDLNFFSLRIRSRFWICGHLWTVRSTGLWLSGSTWIFFTLVDSTYISIGSFPLTLNLSSLFHALWRSQ